MATVLNCTIKKLGCFESCGDIEFVMTADQSGTHVLKYEWMGRTYKQNFEAVIDEKFKVKNHFNEDTSIVFNIIQPDGSVYADGDGNNCFQMVLQPCFNTTDANDNLITVRKMKRFTFPNQTGTSLQFSPLGDVAISDVNQEVNIHIGDGTLMTVTDDYTVTWSSGQLSVTFTYHTLEDETVNVFVPVNHTIDSALGTVYRKKKFTFNNQTGTSLVFTVTDTTDVSNLATDIDVFVGDGTLLTHNNDYTITQVGSQYTITFLYYALEDETVNVFIPIIE